MLVGISLGLHGWAAPPLIKFAAIGLPACTATWLAARSAGPAAGCAARCVRMRDSHWSKFLVPKQAALMPLTRTAITSDSGHDRVIVASGMLSLS